MQQEKDEPSETRLTTLSVFVPSLYSGPNYMKVGRLCVIYFTDCVYISLLTSGVQ